MIDVRKFGVTFRSNCRNAVKKKHPVAQSGALVVKHRIVETEIQRHGAGMIIGPDLVEMIAGRSKFLPCRDYGRADDSSFERVRKDRRL